ncbi:hypothetical protein [Cognatilysobacter bugurensis]|uniref:Uncharacterized protein n=1 Tax=Cognatilysobacter bugurensis TaxID=543356 RepID=A0A918W692_9GAMM|nr:hypothetical protein [Lysobacter bugurensis]GHA72872.1 hypothetical protein GCM10007067_06850 [Lysobacter bugurensis]
MDKHQADAVAEAILKPDRAHQEAIARRRAAYDKSIAERRVVAKWTLVGCAVGAAAAYLTGVRFTEGVIWGGLAATAVGWLVVLWRRHRRAA